MSHDSERERALGLAFDELTQRPVRKTTQGIKKQVIEGHFFRAPNGDPTEGSPRMPMILVSETGSITIMGAIEEWWGSVYEPVLHSNGYLLRIIAERKWRYPWRIAQANIIPLALSESEADQ